MEKWGILGLKRPKNMVLIGTKASTQEKMGEMGKSGGKRGEMGKTVGNFGCSMEKWGRTPTSCEGPGQGSIDRGH